MMAKGGFLPAWLALAALMAAPAHLLAQDGFLFHQPRVSMTFHLGYDAPLGPRSTGGDQDIFGFTQSRLTIGDSDHDALSLGGEIAVRLTDRFDVVFDYAHASSSTRSEFRDWVDLDDLPIQQETSFSRNAFTVGARYFLTERGVPVGQFAWVPRSWSPYVGAGVGVMTYDFLQTGDFVDFETLDIFSTRLRSNDSGPMAHILAGIQYSIAPNWILTGEARYRWASAELKSDFIGFDDIDLTGLQATVGIGVRF